MTELGEPVVKILDRGFALFEKLGDEAFIALLSRLLPGKEFFNVIGFALLYTQSCYSERLRKPFKTQK